MFKQARQNSYIYILTKGINPILETGVIQTVSQPRVGQFNPQQQNPYQYPQPMVVDIVANVGADRRNLNGLPADLDIADYNGNVVVTLDKDKICNEIQVLYKDQEAIVNGHDRAKELMGIYSGMLNSLNPEQAEKRAQADKIAALEKSLADQSAVLQQTMEQNRLVMEQNRQFMEQMQAFMSQSAGSNNKSSKTKENA